jgi:hypothetical protein
MRRRNAVATKPIRRRTDRMKGGVLHRSSLSRGIHQLVGAGFKPALLSAGAARGRGRWALMPG